MVECLVSISLVLIYIIQANIITHFRGQQIRNSSAEGIWKGPLGDDRKSRERKGSKEKERRGRGERTREEHVREDRRARDNHEQQTKGFRGWKSSAILWQDRLRWSLINPDAIIWLNVTPSPCPRSPQVPNITTVWLCGWRKDTRAAGVELERRCTMVWAVKHCLSPCPTTIKS